MTIQAAAASGPGPETVTLPRKSDTRFWDLRARKYAASPISDMVGYERTLARTRDFLTSEDRVLEIGCGTGNTALNQAPYVGHITGSDISPEMIAIANERLAENGAANAEFIVASADDSRFANARYDAVMAHSILHLVPDLDRTLTCMRALLKPGGHLISKTPCVGEMNPVMNCLVIPAMRLVGQAPHVNALTAAKLKDAFSRNGFEIVAVEYHSSGKKGGNPFTKVPSPFIAARRA